MINSPPSERPPPPPLTQSFGNTGKSAPGIGQWTKLIRTVYGKDRDSYGRVQSSPAPPRISEDQYPAAATAAVALAQLHNHRPDSDWESEAVGDSRDPCGALAVRSLANFGSSSRITPPKVKPDSPACILPSSFRLYRTISTNKFYLHSIPQDRGSFYLPCWRTLRRTVLLHCHQYNVGILYRERKSLVDPENRRSRRIVANQSMKKADQKITHDDSASKAEELLQRNRQVLQQ